MFEQKTYSTYSTPMFVFFIFRIEGSVSNSFTKNLATIYEKHKEFNHRPHGLVVSKSAKTIIIRLKDEEIKGTLLFRTRRLLSSRV
jgi:hypothetical protein